MPTADGAPAPRPGPEALVRLLRALSAGDDRLVGLVELPGRPEKEAAAKTLGWSGPSGSNADG